MVDIAKISAGINSILKPKGYIMGLHGKNWHWLIGYTEHVGGGWGRSNRVVWVALREWEKRVLVYTVYGNVRATWVRFDDTGIDLDLFKERLCAFESRCREYILAQDGTLVE